MDIQTENKERKIQLHKVTSFTSWIKLLKDNKEDTEQMHDSKKYYAEKCYRVFASKDLKSTALMKWKHEIGTILETVNSKGQLIKREYLGEKFAGQSDHVFIENGDIQNNE